jgi:ceramide glucosyltransferase
VIWLAAPALAAGVYWLLVIVAAFRWRTPVAEPATAGISILKPVRGRDPHFYQAIRSHALQDYPAFEILFGVASPDDPALDDIQRLIAEFPDRQIRIVTAQTTMANAKVGVLADLADQALYPLLLINDSDIHVPPDYIRQVAAAIEQPGTGLVTCLYRAQADAVPGRWEGLGIATEFVPSVLVARLLHAAEFACGATMLLRAADLARIGGFASIGDYLADDYQLGQRICSLGTRISFAPCIVDTHLGSEGWGQAWRHQLRWSRTIRVSRPGGYFGYVITHATFWALLALAAGAWPAALFALSARIAGGLCAAGLVLRDAAALRRFYLIPLRDLWGFAIWLCGLIGTTVDWRGERLRISPDGKILRNH